MSGEPTDSDIARTFFRTSTVQASADWQNRSSDLHQHRAVELDHLVAGRIEAFGAHRQNAPAGPRRKRAVVEPGAGVADRLAGKDRLQPFEVLEAGRGAELGRRPRAVPLAPSGVAMLQRIQAEAVCQPDAQRPPSTLFFAASSSTWKGCGSYLRANALIASGVECVACRDRRRRRGGRICRGSLRRLAGQEHAGVLQLEYLLRRAGWRVRCGWRRSQARPRLRGARAITVLLPVSVSPASTGFFHFA